MERGISDAAAYHNDRRFDQQPTFAALGLPCWEGSDAQTSLKLDIITEGLHLQLTPKPLHESRREYQVFDLKTFRGHIHQEVKPRKFIATF